MHFTLSEWCGEVDRDERVTVGPGDSRKVDMVKGRVTDPPRDHVIFRRVVTSLCCIL